MTVCSKCCVAPPRAGCREEADRRTMAPLSPARRDVINTAVRAQSARIQCVFI